MSESLEIPDHRNSVNPNKHHHRFFFRSPLIVSLFIVIATTGILAYLLLGLRAGYGLPRSAISEVKDFKVYYIRKNFSTDFQLDDKTISYRDGVLEFSMTNPVGKKLIFTEESIPPHFDPSTLNTSSQFNTEYGLALITNDSDRTVGSFFSTDKTWVIVNAPDPIGSSLMQQFMGALVPAKLSE